MSKTAKIVLTIKGPITGRLTRRVKHFSGYNVFSGRDDRADSESVSIESGRPAAPSISAVKP